MSKNKKRYPEIILASGSPRRQKILKQAGLKFKVVKSTLDENSLISKLKKISHIKLAKVLALAKVEICCSMSLHGKEIICGFDTIVVCKNKIIGKPKNKKDALRKLLFLSNKTHKVITGMAIADLKKQKVLTGHEITKVSMKKISKKEGLNYVNSNEGLDKAGSYAIQGKGKKLIKHISGDYLNVVGLPLKKFLYLLLTIS